LATQHLELVPKHEDLDVHRAFGARWAGRPTIQSAQEEVQQSEEHRYDPFRVGTADRTKRQLSGADRTLCAPQDDPVAEGPGLGELEIDLGV